MFEREKVDLFISHDENDAYPSWLFQKNAVASTWATVA
jgi:hypothetical protein